MSSRFACVLLLMMLAATACSSDVESAPTKLADQSELCPAGEDDLKELSAAPDPPAEPDLHETAVAILENDVGSETAAQRLFEEALDMESSKPEAAATLLASALALAPDRRDIRLAQERLKERTTPAPDLTFRTATELIGCEPFVQQGIELAIAISKTKNVPLPQSVIDQYPTDQQCFGAADQLAALGHADEARELAELRQTTVCAAGVELPERYKGSNVDRIGNYSETAESVLTALGRFAAAAAVALAVLGAAFQILRKLARHRFWNRDLEVAIGKVTNGTEIKGADGTARAVLQDELNFAAKSSSSIVGLNGASVDVTPVELPEQIKVLGPVLDFFRRGARYVVDVEIAMHDVNRILVVGHIANAKGQTIVSRSFDQVVKKDEQLVGVTNGSVRLTAWVAFELLRLKSWPRIRKHLEDAPRVLGTARVDSYAEFRKATRGSQPETAGLLLAYNLSPDNYGAAFSLGTARIREALPASPRTLMTTTGEPYSTIEPALDMLERALDESVSRPMIKPTWERKLLQVFVSLAGLSSLGVGFFALWRWVEGTAVMVAAAVFSAAVIFMLVWYLLLSPYSLRSLWRTVKIDPGWFQGAYRVAVANFHTYAALTPVRSPKMTVTGSQHAEANIHLEESYRHALKLARAIGATHYTFNSLPGARFWLWLRIPDFSTRRAIIEMTHRDGTHFASILAAISYEYCGMGSPEEPRWRGNSAGLFKMLSNADQGISTENLLQKIASTSSSVDYQRLDPRVYYNRACYYARTGDEAKALEELESFLVKIPRTELPTMLPWIRKDPTLKSLWKHDRLTQILSSAETRLAGKNRSPSAKWTAV